MKKRQANKILKKWMYVKSHYKPKLEYLLDEETGEIFSVANNKTSIFLKALKVVGNNK